MRSYSTLTEGINDLRKYGYTEDFNLKPDCIECRDIKLFPQDFHVDQFFRFEDMTNPSDQAILYAISSPVNNLKGILVNGYGIYSDPVADELAAKLKVHDVGAKQ